MSAIILVENHLPAGGQYLAALRALGHNVRLAQTGADALTLAAAQRPDLIVAIDGMPMVERVPLVDLLNATPKLHNLRLLVLTVNHTSNGQPGATELYRRVYDNQLEPEGLIATVEDVLAKPAPPVMPEPVEPVQPIQPALAPAPMQTLAPNPALAPAPSALPSLAPSPIMPEPLQPPAPLGIGLAPMPEPTLMSAAPPPSDQPSFAPVAQPVISGAPQDTPSALPGGSQDLTQAISAPVSNPTPPSSTAPEPAATAPEPAPMTSEPIQLAPEPVQTAPEPMPVVPEPAEKSVIELFSEPAAEKAAPPPKPMPAPPENEPPVSSI